MVSRSLPHIGPRTVKTGLAVSLALFLADLRGSPSPIFAAIGAIGAMSRTLGDAFETCLTQFCGILLGASFGTVFVSIFPEFRYIRVGLGLILLILICVGLRLHFAVSLAGIVLISICLSPPEEAFFYGINRLVDTSIGLATALVINVCIKPYNNYKKVCQLFTHFLQSVPAYVQERVLDGRYPDLLPLRQQMVRLSDELAIFDKQHLSRSQERKEQAAMLRGCEQLAQSILDELSALCTMDEQSRLSTENAERLSIMGLSAQAPISVASQADIVGNYHLANLISAYEYLHEFLSQLQL